MFIDCHAHLHVKEFDADRLEAIERARKAGVSKIINVGFDIEGNFQALALAKKYDRPSRSEAKPLLRPKGATFLIYATMGIHPHLASEWNDAVGAKIFDAAKKEEKIIALGEMGLDYYKNFQPPDLQKKVFQAQLRLAKELDLPVIIHCRDAFDDAFKFIDESKITNTKVLLHCFTGSLEVAQQAWKRGFFTSFTGIVTYPKAHGLREVVACAPLDKMLFETDCPFLAPVPYRGKRNEPAYVKEIYEYAARIKKLSIEELGSRVFQNANRLFWG